MDGASPWRVRVPSLAFRFVRVAAAGEAVARGEPGGGKAGKKVMAELRMAARADKMTQEDKARRRGLRS